MKASHWIEGVNHLSPAPLRHFAAEREKARAASGAASIVADEYGLASELAFHLHRGVLAAEPRWATFGIPPAPPQTGPLLLVRSTRRAGAPDPRIWGHAAQLGTWTRGRAGIAAEGYTFWRVDPPSALPVVKLPPG